MQREPHENQSSGRGGTVKGVSSAAAAPALGVQIGASRVGHHPRPHQQQPSKRAKFGVMGHHAPAGGAVGGGSIGIDGVEFEPHFSAAISGDADYVQRFLAAGGDVNSVDRWQESMLHKAALNNQTAVVDLLLGAGGKVNQRNECQQTPLHYACISGGLTSVKALLDRGADVHARDKFQQAPLHCACIYGHVEVATLVLDAGADIDAVDQHLMAPLHYSCANGHLDIVESVVSAGADMNIADQDGKTPLHTACNWGELRIIQYLVNHGSATDVVDHTGRRPLQCLDSETILELNELEGCDKGAAAAAAAAAAAGAVERASSTAVSAPGMGGAEVQAFSLIEKMLARQQMEVDALRTKTSHDHSRLEQVQARQAWVIDQEVAARERQGQQIIGVAQQISRFEAILKKTAFLHKEVAEQQNRAIMQLQAATQTRASQLVDVQSSLERRVDTEQGHNQTNTERIAKLLEDSAVAASASAEHRDQIGRLEESMAKRDALFAQQQSAIEIILKQADDARESEARARSDAMKMARAMEAKFERQEKHFAVQEAANRALIVSLADRVAAMTKRSSNDTAAAAAVAQDQAEPALAQEAAPERDGLVALTAKYYDLLTKQQMMLLKLQEDIATRDATVKEQQDTIADLQKLKPDRAAAASAMARAPTPSSVVDAMRRTPTPPAGTSIVSTGSPSFPRDSLHAAVRELVVRGTEGGGGNGSGVMDLEAEAVAAAITVAAVSGNSLQEGEILAMAESIAQDDEVRDRAVGSTARTCSGASLTADDGYVSLDGKAHASSGKRTRMSPAESGGGDAHQPQQQRQDEQAAVQEQHVGTSKKARR